MPEMKNVPLSKLKTHPLAARHTGLDEARCRRYAKAWDPAACGILLGVPSNGDVLLLDGNHRKRAAELRDLDSLPVEILQARSDSDTAKLILDRDTHRTRHPIDLYRLGVAAEDPIWLGVDQVLKEFGLRPVGSGGRRNGFGAFSRAYKLSKQGTFSSVIAICHEAWGDHKNAYDTYILAGIGFVLLQRPAVDILRLKKSLTRVGLPAILTAYNARRTSHMGGTSANSTANMANVLLEAYNSGLREAQRIPAL